MRQAIQWSELKHPQTSHHASHNVPVQTTWAATCSVIPASALRKNLGLIRYTQTNGYMAPLFMSFLTPTQTSDTISANRRNATG